MTPAPIIVANCKFFAKDYCSFVTYLLNKLARLKILHYWAVVLNDPWNITLHLLQHEWFPAAPLSINIPVCGSMQLTACWCADLLMVTVDSISLVMLWVLQLAAPNRYDQAEGVKKKKNWQAGGISLKADKIPGTDWSFFLCFVLISERVRVI